LDSVFRLINKIGNNWTKERIREFTMNELKSKITSNIIIALIAALAIIASSLILVDGVEAYKSGKKKIIVTGSAKQQITSDLIVWTGSFTAKSPALQDA